MSCTVYAARRPPMQMQPTRASEAAAGPNADAKIVMAGGTCSAICKTK